MKRMLFCFLLGTGAGAFGHWYFTQEAGREQLRQTRETVAAGAQRVATNISSRVSEFGESGVDTIKEELNRTGMVVREKARSAGQSIADATANARLTASVKARLVKEPGIPSFSINVDTTDGLVTLSGRVETHEQVAKAVKVAFETEGVRKVVSTLQVAATK